VNTVDEIKARISAATANVTEDMLQCNWQEVDYKCDVCRAADGAHCEVFFAPNKFSTCTEKDVSIVE
jgi:hypothetical protein